MKKLLALAGAMGIMTAACSGGHGASSMLPGAANRPASSAQAPSTMGAHTVRPMASVTAPAGWAPTATGALTLANATDLGHLDAAHSVNVVLGLQMRNVDAV